MRKKTRDQIVADVTPPRRGGPIFNPVTGRNLRAKTRGKITAAVKARPHKMLLPNPRRETPSSARLRFKHRWTAVTTSARQTMFNPT